MKPFQTNLLLQWIGGMILIAATGCQTWDTSGTIPIWSSENWKKKDRSVTDPPQKIVAVWTEATHHRPDQPAERGFGGRVIFYDAKERTTKIDGRVTIFVFDDQNATLENPAPKYKFVFPQDSVQAFYSKSELGHTYSFWVPLGSIDAPTQHFSLVVRFDSPTGERVLSEMTKKILVGSGAKGTKSPPQQESNQNIQQPQPSAPSSVQQASFQQTIPASNQIGQVGQVGIGQVGIGQVGDQSDADRIRVETIQVSPSFARRLNLPKQQSEEKAVWQTTTGSGVQTTQVAQNDKNTQLTKPSSADINQDSSLQELATVLHASQSGFSPRQFPAPSKLTFQPTGAAPRREPHPGGWQLGLPPTPRTGFQTDRSTVGSARPEFSPQAQRWFEQMNRTRSQNEGGAKSSGVGYPLDD